MPDSVFTHGSLSKAASAPAGSEAPGELLTNRRSADPAVLTLLDHTRRMTVDEQLYLFRVAARRLRRLFEEDQADAVEAAEACVRDLGLSRAPSREVYRQWQSDQPAWREWPTAHFAAAAFGGNWTRLRSVIDAEPVTHMAAFAMSRNGGPAADEALLEGLRRWHRAAPDPLLRFARFRAWAKDNIHLDTRQHAFRFGDDLPEVDIHLALSPNTYIKRFGTWAGALAQADVLDGISFESYIRLMRTDRYTSDDALLGFLKEADRVTRAATGRALTRETLDVFRMDRLRSNWAANVYEPVPSAETIAGRFGSLIDAMIASGVCTDLQASRRSVRRGRKLPVDRLALYAVVCARRHGVEVTELRRIVYKRWREDLVERLLEPIPTYVTFLARFGCDSWPEAMKRVALAGLSEHAIDELSAQLTSSEGGVR